MPVFLRLLLVSLLFSTCAGGSSSGEGDFVGPFFDLKGYMQDQIDSLQQASVQVEKTIILNGQTETQLLDNIDFEQELRLFQQADINRPAWIDEYHTETEDLGEGRNQTVYTAIDATLFIRRLTIIERNGLVEVVDIIRRTGSVLSEGQQELQYRPNEGYRILAEQSARVGGDLETEITARFSPQ